MAACRGALALQSSIMAVEEGIGRPQSHRDNDPPKGISAR